MRWKPFEEDELMMIFSALSEKEIYDGKAWINPCQVMVDEINTELETRKEGK